MHVHTPVDIAAVLCTVYIIHDTLTSSRSRHCCMYVMFLSSITFSCLLSSCTSSDVRGEWKKREREEGRNGGRG